jgi:hypothetical protein
MSRFRVTVVMAGLVVASAALALNSSAQPPGGPGGRGGRGQGGPGGPGGFGMWGGPGGGPGGNLVTLAGNDAVQKELKLTDKQKAQVKKIADDSNTRRRDVFQNLRQQADAAKNQALQEAQANVEAGQQADPSLDARGSGAGNPLINSLNQRGYQPPIYGGQQLNDPAAQGAQQGQARAAANNAQAQGWQMMREAMDQLQHESDNSLARALEKNQVKRLKEIQLQVEGPFAVLRPEIAEKLELGEEQVAQIQEIQNESNQARRQAGAATRNIFAGFRKNQQANNPQGNNQAGAAPADPNAPAAQARNGNNGGNGRGRNGRGGNNAGGAGGNGPGGRGNFDPDAMRKYMEQPEVKAQMEQARQQQDKIRDQSYSQVYRVLDRRQSSAFKKMLGKPFDVDSMMGGFFRGPGQRGGGATPAATTDSAKDDTAKPAEAQAKSDQPAASKPATSSRRSSLRERRGLGQQQPQQ